MISFEMLYSVSKHLMGHLDDFVVSDGGHLDDPRVFYNWTANSRWIEAFRDLRVRIAVGIMMLTCYSGIPWMMAQWKKYQSASFFLIESADSSSKEDCSICYDDPDQTMVHLPSCKHLYHRKCILSWLQSHLSCPMCRQTVTKHTP